MTMHRLKFTYDQLMLMTSSLEEFFRLRMGQDYSLSEELGAAGLDIYGPGHEACFQKYLDRRSVLKEIMKGFFQIAFDGPYCPGKTEDMLVAMDIWDAVRVYTGMSRWNRAMQESSEPSPGIKGSRDCGYNIIFTDRQLAVTSRALEEYFMLRTFRNGHILVEDMSAFKTGPETELSVIRQKKKDMARVLDIYFRIAGSELEDQVSCYRTENMRSALGMWKSICEYLGIEQAWVAYEMAADGIQIEEYKVDTKKPGAS